MNNKISFCSIAFKTISYLILAFSLIFSPLSSHAASTLSSSAENITQLRLQGQVCYEDICLSYDPSIATNVIAEKSPEQDLDFSYISENVNFRFEGYPIAIAGIEPAIYIMPVSKASRFSMEIDTLRSTLVERPDPTGIQPPLIPWINAGYDLVSKMSYLEFESGSGIRFVANLGQGVDPDSVDGMFYSFQGLTNDGEYYVAARLPISVNFTPAATPSVDSSFEELFRYNEDLSVQVGQIPDNEFFPSISALDAVIQSLAIGVQPSPPIQQPSSTLCGQVKLATSKDGPNFFPVLIGCQSEDVYLLQPASFQENVHYKIYDPVIATIAPRSSQDYGEITKEITSWARIEEINSCEACGLGPSLIVPSGGATDLQLVSVEVKGSPEAFKPFELVLTVQNNGFARFEPSSGQYQVKVEFIEDFPYNNTVLLFDSEFADIDRWLSPKTIPTLEPCADSIDQLCGDVQIKISNLHYPATYTGSLHVTLIPKEEDTNSSNNSLSKEISVGASDQSYKHCAGTALKAVGTFSAVPMSANPAITPKYLETITRVDSRCQGNESCVANETNQFLESMPEELFKLTPIGRAALITKGLIETLLEGSKCAAWGWNLVQHLNDQWRANNLGINIAAVESPAFILVENQAGQQAGFDDQGSILQSIPDSYAFIVNEEKVVVYPADQQATVRLKGTGSGVMNVRLIWVENDQPTKVIFYEAVPVTSSTVATVNSSDSRFALNVDENGDGNNDQVFSPSITESQSKNLLNSSNLILLAGVGFLLLGLFLFLRFSFKR